MDDFFMTGFILLLCPEKAEVVILWHEDFYYPITGTSVSLVLALSVCLFSCSLSPFPWQCSGVLLKDTRNSSSAHILLTRNHCLPQRSEKQYKAPIPFVHKEGGTSLNE